ncbi:MAG: amidohydrolase family protein [Oceanicola sp.]|nr:amidohydrolase family protein [Oceanicola sp.]
MPDTKPLGNLPIDPPTAPEHPLPQGACDAHLHMLAKEAAFPLWEGRVEDPAEGSLQEWVARQRRHGATLGLGRTVVVHSILYGADNAVTLAAVAALGKDRARGIGLVRDGADPSELDALAAAGVMGIRLNYVHGGVLSWAGAKALAPALAARGMHIQMLLHTHQHMTEIADDLRDLPVPVCFDHMGWPDVSLGVDDPGFQTLCALLKDGLAWVKLSGAYRLARTPATVDPFAKALLDANDTRCVWGSDWPHIMLADAEQPDSGALLTQLIAWCGGSADRLHRVLVSNPEALYGFDPSRR